MIDPTQIIVAPCETCREPQPMRLVKLSDGKEAFQCTKCGGLHDVALTDILCNFIALDNQN